MCAGIRTLATRALCVALVAAAPAAWAADPLTPEGRAKVLERMERRTPARGKLSIPFGDTVLVERVVKLKRKLTGPETDYEGLVTGITAPNGIEVPPRIDRFTFEPGPGAGQVRFVYAIQASPSPTRGGRVQLTLSLVKRRGLANVALKEKVTHWVKTQPPAPSPKDLAMDFWAYRIFADRVQSGRTALARARLRVSTKAGARLPPLNRARAASVAKVYEYVRDRRRMWMAHRRLVSASQQPDPKVSNAARAYLAALDKPDSALASLPAVALVDAPARAAEVEPVTPLEPTASEPVAPAPPPPTASGGSGAPLAPSASYDPNAAATSGDTSFDPTVRREAPPPAPEPAAPDPEAPLSTDATFEDDDAGLREGFMEARVLRKRETIPGYNRGLVLDDPNIAHGAAFRMAWAEVETRESAVASAFFFFGQVAFTPYVGLELTVPTEFVDIDLDRARSVFAMGNPLIAAKWRFHLPEVLGRRPALTVRGRAALPITPLNNVPPTPFGAEEFTREAHFADTYAFFLEKTDIGAGASIAWQYDLLHLGAQFYTDYFFPVSDAIDQTDFLTLSYGLSVGALPWGDLVGFYAEARATSLLAGPRRTEFFTYLGVRGRLFDYFEPALWVVLPLGSVRNVNTYQIGAELRFSYDVYDVIDDTPSGGGRDTPLIE